jgi:hypothetical protein
MRAELHNFDTLKVWRLVDLPIDKNVMSCKWVFDIMYDATGAFEKLKARLTCRGFTQQTAQWDCTAAFLQSDADCEMYMEQPPGFVQDDERAKVYGTGLQDSPGAGGCTGQGGRVPLYLQIKGWFGVCAYTR